MSERRGRFITLEGGEGAGKSTQARLLADRLAELGIECVTTREPGGSPGAEQLRKALLSGLVEPLGPTAEAMVFSAARIDHLDALIRPSLARSAWVVCDRFVDSTRAYQGAQGKVDPALLRMLEKVVVGEDMPDLTLILDLPPETGVARAAARRGAEGADRFEKQDFAFHRGLREAFLAIAAREPERCVTINADQTPELVARDIWTTVNRKLRPARWLASRAGEPSDTVDAP